MPLVRGGRSPYGLSFGIQMLGAHFPPIPAGLGNATTFSYPVLYHVVKQATPERVVLQSDPSLLEPFAATARSLEQAGVAVVRLPVHARTG